MLAKYRIGMITPSVNTALEPITSAIVRDMPDVSVHYTRIPVSEITLSPDSTSQFAPDRFEAPARLLVDARVQVVAWNGTSGSWLGIGEERQLCRELGEKLGVPFITTTLALVDTLNECGIRRYSLAVPFSKDVAEQIVGNYEREGFQCVRLVYRDWDTDHEAGATDAALVSLMADAVHPDSEAIVVVCTNIATAPLVQGFEDHYGSRVVDSVTVTARQSLRACGVASPAFAGWGAIGAGVERGEADVIGPKAATP